MADQSTIAEFLIGLGFKIDPAQQNRFVDGLKTSHDHIQRVGRGMSDLLDKFATVATAATGTAIGLASALANIGQKMAGVGYAADRIGTTPERIKALDYAIRQVGGAAGEAQAGLERIANLSAVNPGLLQRVFGIKPGTDPAEAMLQIGQYFQKMIATGDAAQISVATQQAQSILGMGRAEMLRLADPRTRPSFDEELSRRGRFGLVGKDLEDLTKETDRQLKRLHQQFGDFGEWLYADWGKLINSGLQAITTWLDAHQPQITTYLSGMRKHFEDLNTTISQAWSGLSPESRSWLTDLGIIGGGALVVRSGAGILERIGSLIGVGGLGKLAGLLGLGGALLILKSDYDTWKETEGKGSIIDWGKWEPAITSVTSAVDNFNKNIIIPMAEKLGINTTFIPAFEGLAAFLALSFLPRIMTPIRWLLTALAMIPGSGVTAAMLSPLGIALLAPAALSGDTPKTAEEEEERRKWRERTPEETEKFKRDWEAAHPGQRFETFGGMAGRLWRERPRWLGGSGRATQTADDTMPTEQRAFLDTLAGGESKTYTDQNPTSTAYGRYQFIDSTDKSVSAATGINANDPVSQDRKAWYLASQTYKQKTGRDLGADLKAGGHQQEIVNALKGVWPSLPGGSQQNTTPEQWMQRMASNIQAYKKPPDAAAAPAPTATPTSKLDFEGMIRNSGIANVSAPPNLGGAALTPTPATISQNDQSREVNVNAPSNVTITGVSDPERAASLVNRSMERHSGNMIRNLKPVIA